MWYEQNKGRLLHWQCRHGDVVMYNYNVVIEIEVTQTLPPLSSSWTSSPAGSSWLTSRETWPGLDRGLLQSQQRREMVFIVSHSLAGSSGNVQHSEGGGGVLTLLLQLFLDWFILKGSKWPHTIDTNDFKGSENPNLSSLLSAMASYLNSTFSVKVFVISQRLLMLPALWICWRLRLAELLRVKHYKLYLRIFNFVCGSIYHEDFMLWRNIIDLRVSKPVNFCKTTEDDVWYEQSPTSLPVMTTTRLVLWISRHQKHTLMNGYKSYNTSTLPSPPFTFLLHQMMFSSVDWINISTYMASWKSTYLKQGSFTHPFNFSSTVTYISKIRHSSGCSIYSL